MKTTRRTNSSGFSLMELMIALAIVGILARIAIPAYTDQVRKTRRADAQSVLLELTQSLERFYTNNNTFVGATLPITQAPKEGATKYYNLSFTAAQTATAFSIRAVPIAGSDQASDRCGTMTITNAGVKTVSTSATGCWR